MRNLLYVSLSHNTRASYSSGVNAFIDFCLQYRRFTHYNSILPATEETLMLFVSHLSLKVSPPTIKVYLAAVRNLHMEAGFPEVFDNLTLLPRLVRGIKRVFTKERRPRLPITPQILVQFNQHLNLHWRDHSILWSAMIIAFFAFLRSSELLAIALRRSDVTILDDRSDPPTFGLRIRSSKTDPFRHTVTVHIAPSSHATFLCTSKALVGLINLPYITHPDTPLLQWSNGTVITRQSFNNAIKLLIRNIRLNESLYSTHSFRIGAATTAHAAGIPDCLIRTLGRGASEAYQVYIRTPDSILDTVPRSLVSQNL